MGRASARSRASSRRRASSAVSSRPGGVEPGSELEADFVGAEQGRGLSDSLQGDQAGALGGVEALQAGGDQDAVFAGQRDDVGNGAEGDQVEQGAQVEVGCAGQAGFAAALEEGMGEFEGEAGGAEFGEGRGGVT